MSNSPNLHAELRRHNLLAALLQRQIIAEAVAGEELAEGEYANAKKQFMLSQKLENEDDLIAFRTRQGWGEEDAQWQIGLPLKIQKHCERNYRHRTEAYFLNRKNQLDQVIYSLIRVADDLLAQELYWRIKAGEASFGDLASTFAEGPERNTKGIIGPVRMSQAHPILAEALRISKPGQLMKPIRINEWSIVARLEAYEPATFDEEMAEGLSRELFEQWVSEVLTRRMEGSADTGVKPNAK